MTREQEKPISKVRREERQSKSINASYSEQALRAQCEANQAYGFKFRSQDGR